LQRKQVRPQELRGDIDGSLVVGRGLDELWLHVTTVKEASWLYKLRARVVRFGNKGGREAIWLRTWRRVRARTLGFGSNGTRGANGNVKQGAILKGSFEAKIFTSHS
jgi:hypothetical protein